MLSPISLGGPFTDLELPWLTHTELASPATHQWMTLPPHPHLTNPQIPGWNHFLIRVKHKPSLSVFPLSLALSLYLSPSLSLFPPLSPTLPLSLPFSLPPSSSVSCGHSSQVFGSTTVCLLPAVEPSRFT